MSDALPAVGGSPPPDSQLLAMTPLLQRWRRRGLVALAAWLAAFAVWMALAPVSGAAVGAGAFKVDTNRKSVTHRDGGIVAEIHVREGQIVSAGQLLVTLEDVRVDTSVDLLQAQLDAERLRESRCAAEASLSPDWQVHANPQVADAAKRAPDALARERGIFLARRSTLEAQQTSARSQSADVDQEIAAHQRNLRASADGERLAREELASNEALLKDNFVNRNRVIALERTVSEYASRTHAIEADLAQARQHRADLEGRLATLRQAHVQSASDDLRDATARIVDLQARLRAASDSARRQRVLAPVGGRLVDLKVNTPGSAVGPREPIVDIVPEGLPLLAEARLAADAVSGVHVGQAADLHLPGHVFRNLGMLDGKVVNVSADALVEPRSGITFFTVLIEPSPASLARLIRENVGPGMAVEVYINTSRRTPLEFLFDPLGSALRRAFRDQ
ncbi:MAG: HlyD family type I secretion periplasmic adaptor subunit [Burkholderiaceae bacterium]|nr:HlyD family type I secretion periplasmic adaptor subunit [Burkholderiaceae bacterium]